MQIILLSGGSGKRLWPLSNNARSKQFIKLLQAPNGEKESMLQRVIRQLTEAGMSDSVTIATSYSQCDAILNQLGDKVNIVTEPERRDTFPAIALACSYLKYEKHCSEDEVVAVMPCDSYTEAGYFDVILKMAEAIQQDKAELALMGIQPTYPSAKYGYIVPETSSVQGGVYKVSRFTEKPEVSVAERLIREHAFWNGGVFAFRLGYLLKILEAYVSSRSFADIRARYAEFPKISFDYEVVEKAASVAVLPFAGQWKDLGTWNTLTDELSDSAIGNVILDGEGKNTHVINELEIPIMCMGTENLVIAASNDGILISEKKKSENIKKYADTLQTRPMFEECRWGEYKIVTHMVLSDGTQSLTKQLKISAGKSVNYQQHSLREEILTVLDGEGLFVKEGKTEKIGRGSTLTVLKGEKHGIWASADLVIIEVQLGNVLLEEDFEEFDWNW